VNIVNTIHHKSYPAIDPNQWDLSGRAVLVTGASRGIGRATALSYARAGASQIAILARSSTDLDEVETSMLAVAHESGRKPPDVLKIAVDVTDATAVGSAAAATRATFGRLDVLVNNAGFSELNRPIVESDAEEWWTTWTVNVRGPYLVTRAFLPLLLESSNGARVIVNVASVAALRVRPGASAYFTSKLALLRFNEFIELEYGSKGVVPIAIHPGAIFTDMARRLPEEYHSIFVDTPELAADFIVWLSKDKKAWLSGRYVSCNWDVTELEAKEEEIVEGDKLKVRMVV